jgi:ribosomal protein S3
MHLLRLKEHSFKQLNLYYFRDVFLSLFVILNNAYVIMVAAIKTIDKNNSVIISYSSLQIRNVTAAQICNYISIKLGQYFHLHQILSPVVRALKRNNTKGFRILVVGRLTRRERAAHVLKQKGSIPLATKTRFVDYAAESKIMRFGAVGIKVWLFNKTSHPCFYTLRFFNNSLSS